MKTDLHTHTRLCNHAAGEPEEYLETASKRGIAVLGVTDHAPWPSGYDPRWRMSAEQFPLYRSMVRTMQEKQEASGVEVLYGIEFDYVPGRMR